MSVVAANDTWQSITLTTDEIWGVNSGVVRFHSFNSTDPTGDDTLGFDVPKGESVRFGSGQTVYYRRGKQGLSQTTNASFVRLEVS